MPKSRFVRCALVVFLLLPVMALAQSKDTKEHKVVKGDTLWDISKLELKDPFLWPRVWKKNPGIKNPDRIYPDQIIRIPVEHAGAEKTGEEVVKSAGQMSRENAASREHCRGVKKDEAAGEPVKAGKKSAASSERRFEDIRGIVLYTGEVIEGQILSMNAEKVVIRTKNDTVLSYLFVEEIEDFIKD